MALGTLPPWLNVTPELFARAREAGARTGLETAQTQLGANKAAADIISQNQDRALRAAQIQAQLNAEAEKNALAQWELNQQLAAKASAQQSEAAQAAAQLEEAARWHTLQNTSDLARTAAQAKHWSALEAGQGAASVRTLPNGQLVKVYPDGRWEEVKPANRLRGMTGTEALNIFVDPVKRAMFESGFGPEGVTGLKDIAKGALGVSPASGTIGTMPSASTQEVERMTKDGKTAIFDANTRQFLRYKQ